MNWRRLFNVRVSTTPRETPGEARTIGAEIGTTGGEIETGQGVFVTPQSLVTFPVATTVVGLMWKAIEALVPALQGSLWTPFVLSAVVGAIIFCIAISEPDSTQSRRDKLIGGLVAVINIFYIFASVAGISHALNGQGPA